MHSWPVSSHRKTLSSLSFRLSYIQVSCIYVAPTHHPSRGLLSYFSHCSVLFLLCFLFFTPLASSSRVSRFIHLISFVSFLVPSHPRRSHLFDAQCLLSCIKRHYIHTIYIQHTHTYSSIEFRRLAVVALSVDCCHPSYVKQIIRMKSAQHTHVLELTSTSLTCLSSSNLSHTPHGAPRASKNESMTVTDRFRILPAPRDS